MFDIHLRVAMKKETAKETIEGLVNSWADSTFSSYEISSIASVKDVISMAVETVAVNRITNSEVVHHLARVVEAVDRVTNCVNEIVVKETK
jgi:hypothetical protein